MSPGPKALTLTLTKKQRAQLQAQAVAVDDNARVAARARIILRCASDLSNSAIAREEDTTQRTVRKVRRRFLDKGLASLHDAPRKGRPKVSITLSEEEREVLLRYVRRGKASHSLVTRSRIVLLCAEGKNDTEVAAMVGVKNNTVGRWRRRFIQDRINGLTDIDRPGSPRKITDDIVESVVVKTLESTPKGATHWSTRSLAKKVGLSHTSVGRIWRALGLKPHRSATFQLSKDPLFIEKVRDVVGLYMNPPDNALVFCVDEKSQIQALNRTQPLLPLRPGQVERGTPEYHRNGTTTLFAALDRATGNVIGKCYSRHRAVEFRKFLEVIRKSVPADMDIHIVVDNYSTHSAPTVKRWFAKNPRFHIHFIPTHSSWLNQVETWFSILTTKQIKRGSHHSVCELKKAIEEFLKAWNEEPTPFQWTKSADQILENVARFCYRTLEAHTDSEQTIPEDF